MPKVSESHLEQRRRQILDAAVACFARKGFHQTTMADIAMLAGVSDTLAYRYFGGKDEIIEAALIEFGDATIDEVLGEPDGVEDVITLADMLLTTNVRRFERHEDLEATMGMYFQTWAAALSDPRIRKEAVDRWRVGFEVAEGLAARGKANGQLPADLDVESFSRVVLAMHYGLNVLAALDTEIDMARCKDVALRMMRGLSTQADATGPDAAEEK